MPRIIAGTAGGRRIAAPPGTATRPTADRVKEALFSSLEPLADLVVLDLFAGSGGLGIEALSRGAAAATFVERDRRAVRVIRDNLDVAGVSGAADVHGLEAARFCAAPKDLARNVTPPYDLILVDPPYAMSHLDIVTLVGALTGAGVVAPAARLVLERDSATDDEPIPDFDLVKDRRYGDTTLRYHRYR